MAEERSQRQIVVGTVVSDKMQKTVVVEIARLTKHQSYERMVRRKTKVKAHDEQSTCRVGDTVRWRRDRCRRTSGGASSRCCRRPSEIFGAPRASRRGDP